MQITPDNAKKLIGALHDMSTSMTRVEAERDIQENIKQDICDELDLNKMEFEKLAEAYHTQNFLENVYKSAVTMVAPTPVAPQLPSPTPTDVVIETVSIPPIPSPAPTDVVNETVPSVPPLPSPAPTGVVNETVPSPRVPVVTLDNAEFGPGPNAPEWARAAGARIELFDAPLPINGQPTMAAGWRGSVGFPGYVPKGREVVYTPGPRVTYPVVQTPLGVKSVFQFIFPGSSRIISAAGQTTVPWPTDQNAGVRVSGTWKGTLAFEWSADNGSTWEPVTLKGEAKDVSTGVSTTGNGIWSLINPISGGRLMQWGNEGKLLRVRAASWTSGSATVAVGMKGGEEPVYATSGGFNNGRKGYIRFLTWMDADYSAEGVPEVKGFYVNTSAGVAHILGFVGRPDARPSNDGYAQLWLQMNASWSTRRFNGSRGPANGQWLDVELLFEMNDADKANGVARGWINGVQQMNATDVPWVPIGTEGTFRGVTLVPVHGGGKAPPVRTNTIQIAAWCLHSDTL